VFYLKNLDELKSCQRKFPVHIMKKTKPKPVNIDETAANKISLVKERLSFFTSIKYLTCKLIKIIQKCLHKETRKYYKSCEEERESNTRKVFGMYRGSVLNCI